MTSLHKPIKIVFTWMMFAAVVVTMVFATTGCGGKKNKSSARIVGAGVLPPACAGCLAGTNLFGSALGNSYVGGGSIIGLQLALQFLTTDNTPVANPNQSMAWGVGYTGGVVARGHMYVTNAGTNYGNCYMHPGTYVVDTIAGGEGYYDGSVMQNVQIQASGPNTLVRLRILGSDFYSATPQLTSCGGQVFPDWMWGQVVIECVNNTACNNFGNQDPGIWFSHDDINRSCQM